MLYRVMDDIEMWEKYREKTLRPRPNGKTRDNIPSTVPIYHGSGKKGDVALRKTWLNWAKELNKISGGYDFQWNSKGLFMPAIGWHNVGKSNRVTQITCSGNIVDVYRTEGNKAYISCFHNDEKIPYGLTVRWDPKRPHPMIHILTTQHWNKLDPTSNGHYPVTFAISTSSKQELWIDIRNLVKI